MASSPITSWKTEGEKVEVVIDFLFLGSNITVLESWLQSWNQNSIASWQESCEKPRRCVENQRHHSADKGPYSQGSGLPSDHVWLWELDSKEGKMSKNWCLLTVALEKLLKVPWRSNQSVLRDINSELIGRTDAEVEAPVFWSFDVKSWLIGKVPDAGKDWGQKHKRASEDEMAGWDHWCNGHELGQTLGGGEGQGGLVCCSPWGHKELDTIGWLNNSNNSKAQFSTVDKVLAIFHRWGNWDFPFLTGFPLFLLVFCLVVLVLAGFHGYHYCEAVGFQSYFRAMGSGMGIGQIKTPESLLFLSRFSYFLLLNKCSLQTVVSFSLIFRVLKMFDFDKNFSMFSLKQILELLISPIPLMS